MDDTVTNTPDVAYNGQHIRVQCLPLTLYIAALGVNTVDYFSLDIEGGETDLLETIPFNEVDIKARTHIVYLWRFILSFRVCLQRVCTLCVVRARADRWMCVVRACADRRMDGYATRWITVAYLLFFCPETTYLFLCPLIIYIRVF